MSNLDQRMQWVFSLGLLLLFTAPLDAGAQATRVDFFEEPYSDAYEDSIASQINAGIDGFLTRLTKKVVANRGKYWHRQFGSPQAYNLSVDPNRKDLRRIIGAVDTIGNVKLKTLGDPDKGHVVAETQNSTIYRVEWTVRKGLKSEGLLLVPKGDIKASAVVIPDADETPGAYAGLESGPGTALKMAENGIKVLVPMLVNRATQFSGSDTLIPLKPWQTKDDSVSVWTNLTHREWIWRQAYVMGKHIIGMEIQKILAGVNWLANHPASSTGGKIGVMGYAEGGLLALYSAAIDTQIDAAWVSGYFGPREQLWREPVYRNIWGLLTEFGDADIASMVAPRSLIIEAAPVPSVKEPLPPKEGQKDCALPGILERPSTTEVKNEVERLKQFFPESGLVHPDITLLTDVSQHGTDQALKVFANRLGVNIEGDMELSDGLTKRNPVDFQKQHHRVFSNMQEYIQDMIPTAARRRYDFFEGDFSSPRAWDRSMEPYRKQFYNKLVGKIDKPLLPMNAKKRQIYDKAGWKGYEVKLDVWPGVYSWGILAVPKDIKPGEKRPAIVMQHGFNGRPTTPISVDSYHHAVNALVNRGFVVFAPYNPYQFTIRKATAIKKSVYSIIIPQHKQILNFLKSRDYVDGSRMALYGKSWGGRTAQRVPIVLEDYSVVISSAYFNNWLNKTVSNKYRNSYYFTSSIGVYEWNMGNTFTHAEMVALTAPRPFMVESGYYDGVAAHEMVALEFAKVKRWYDMMGIGDRIELEFFKGGHEINVEGTFRFLHKHLIWPAPELPTQAQQITEDE